MNDTYNIYMKEVKRVFAESNYPIAAFHYELQKTHFLVHNFCSSSEVILTNDYENDRCLIEFLAVGDVRTFYDADAKKYVSCPRDIFIYKLEDIENIKPSIMQYIEYLTLAVKELKIP